ncbi:AMP-binding protein [Amycolatopsis acidicola]|uniref:AMP-binding protein n=1 Tax=Amycolatopsis acidicola TaxID=2596893 RepID=A0A5N0US50_9PSEU|nr:AMP-binding protein [Amycolatopsis acidicola]KAA9153514.1 AMP-binding protein [Amycolatopsis acidicola]
MPDCVTFEEDLGHPRTDVWKMIAAPELYPRFFRGVGACDRLSGSGRGARYRLRANICGEAVEHELRVLLSRRDEQFVLDSDPDTAGCISVQLVDAGPGRTTVKCIFFRPAGGSRLTANEFRHWVRDGLARMGRYLAGDPEPLPAARPAGALQVANTLVQAGILLPSRPDKVIRQMRALARWGATLAGGYTAAAAREPKGVAVIDEDGEERTFAELSRRADRLASVLEKMGVGDERKVALLARNHAAFVHVLLACGKLGVDVLLLNTGLAEPQVTDAVRRQGVRVLIADDEFTPLLVNLPESAAWLSSGTLDALIDQAEDATFEPPEKPGRLVVLTSGTTGTPKGARRPTPKGLGAAVALLSRIPLRVGERMLISTPLFHTWGLSALQVGMPLRACLVLQRRFDAEECLRAIEEHRVTTMFAVPVMLQRMLALPPEVREEYDTSSLRIVVSSGSALPAALVTGFMDAFGDVLYNFYGSTEVSAAAVATPEDLRTAPATAGYPPLGSRLAVLGPSGEPLPPGEIGWIYVGNDLLFDGYTDGSRREIRHGLMDTGDRGYLDADGRLFVSGRNDDMIVSGGENVFPRPVEEALATLPGVLDAAVIGVPDDEYGQRLVAFVVAHPAARLDEDVVRDYLRHRVARFAMPREVIFIDELPRTQTGKVLKRVLFEDGWLAGNSRFG